MTDTLTRADLDEIANDHMRCEAHVACDDCRACGEPFPCRTTTLVAGYRRMLALAQMVARQIQGCDCECAACLRLTDDFVAMFGMSIAAQMVGEQMLEKPEETPFCRTCNFTGSLNAVLNHVARTGHFNLPEPQLEKPDAD